MEEKASQFGDTLYTVFNIQQNIIRHSKKENVNHNSEKNQSIEINLEVTEMME